MKIKNKFFIRFDYVVRFIYSRFWPINLVLNKIMYWRLYVYKRPKIDYQNLFNKLQIISERARIDIKDKVVLELGPGNSIANAFCFLLLGAKKVYLVDKFTRFLDSKKQRGFYQNEVDCFIKKFGKEELFFINDDLSVKQEYITLIKKDLTETRDLKVDFIYSVSVLEHIKDVESNIRKMFEILLAGGSICHSIDMRDHYDFKNPLLFYKYSDKTWEKWLTQEGFSYTNRLRYNNFINLFKNSGFRVIDVDRSICEKIPKKINEKLAKRDDLEICKMKIFLKKEKDNA